MATLKQLDSKWERRREARKRQKALYRRTKAEGHLLKFAEHGRAMRKLRGLITRKENSPPNKAIKWAAQFVGVTESPAGSNRGPHITGWQEDFGSWLVGLPWCGVFVGKALKAAGVNVDSSVASVAAIEENAKAGKAGFKSWHEPTDGRKGDAAVIGGHGIHVELIRYKIPGVGYATYGGNTSPGRAGSQDNGGGVWNRIRSYSEVHGVARPDYPEA